MTRQPPEPQLLTEPAEGIPPVVDSETELQAALSRLSEGTGHVGLDTERAHGFRYTTKAYLVQIRREGAGTFLIDPTAFEEEDSLADLSRLGEAISDSEWIIHAASQDLGPLAEIQLVPRRLFDTELAGRLLGYPRVSLGVLTEELLGVSLLKEHSASDWSRRPLPTDWLNYAALDVELLGELRDVLAEQLESAGKAEWAAQEFAHLVEHAGDVPPQRDDPWRRTSGIHSVGSQLGMAYVRELWQARDELAASLNIAPGRLVSDRAISEFAAAAQPKKGLLDRQRLRSVAGFRWRNARRYEDVWMAALDRVASLPASEYPPTRPPARGPGAPRGWAGKHPQAYARWQRVRAALNELAESLNVPMENLIAPEAVRQLCFEAPDSDLDEFLEELGVRPWQRYLVIPVVAPLV